MTGLTFEEMSKKISEDIKLQEAKDAAKTPEEIAVDDYERTRVEEGDLKNNHLVCRAWIKNKIHTGSLFERRVAEALSSYMKGNDPFQGMNDERKSKFKELRAYAIWYALVYTGNEKDVTELFGLRSKELKTSIANLGKKLRISILNDDYKNYKGNTPLYKEMMNNVSEHDVLVAQAKICFFEVYDEYREKNVSLEASATDWLHNHKKKKKKGGVLINLSPEISI